MRRTASTKVILFALVLHAIVPLSAMAADLSGHWYVESTMSAPASPFFEWSQTGDTFSVACEVFHSSLAGSCEGTISGEDLAISTPFILDAKVFAGILIDGSAPYGRFLAHRCECFDENQIGGDGCDSDCRIEPCYTCSGEPSVCTPLGDGAACNDRLDCTSGETCTAGNCGGGSAVSGCIDLTGRWKVVTTRQDGLTQLTSDLRDVEQHDGVLRMTRPTAFAITDTYPSPPTVGAEVGAIDSSTGAIVLSDGLAEGSPYWNVKPDSLNASLPSCGPVSIAGTAAANGQSFSGTGSKNVERSFRFGTSGYQRGECTGDRSFDWSAKKCGVGECEVLSDECPPCYRADGAGSCEVGPRSGCLTSLAPKRSSVQILDSSKSTGDKLRWKWNSGASFDAAELGDPASFTGMQICVFDESTPTPQLVFSTYYNPTVLGYEDPAYVWTPKPDTLRFERRTYAGSKETVSWSASSENRSSLFVGGRGGEQGGSGGLVDGYDFDETYFLNEGFFVPMSPPHAPLGLPLRIQARMDHGGACFESLFGAEGVRKNDGGAFTARSTQ